MAVSILSTEVIFVYDLFMEGFMSKQESRIIELEN